MQILHKLQSVTTLIIYIGYIVHPSFSNCVIKKINAPLMIMLALDIMLTSSRHLRIKKNPLAKINTLKSLVKYALYRSSKD